MTREEKQRNPADFPVLGLLCEGPIHGYELCSELRDRLGEIWTLRTSHVYALLAGLERDGLVFHEKVDQETRPAKKIFSITDEGRKTFLDWAQSPVNGVRHVRLEFLAKLHFARRESPAAVADLVRGQLSVCNEAEKRLEGRRPECRNRTEREALEFRLAMVKATADWLSGLLPSEPVRDGQFGRKSSTQTT